MTEEIGNTPEAKVVSTTPDDMPPPQDAETTQLTDVAQPSRRVAFGLDAAEPVDRKTFPHQPRDGSQQLPTTIPNVQYLLSSYKITARYDVIRKKLLIHIPGHSGSPENADNVAIAQIISLATLNGMSSGRVPEYVAAIADRHQISPVADWIKSKPWDGVDRLDDLCKTLETRDDFPEPLKQQLIHRWSISAIAAVLMHAGFKARGVLTLQGPQSIGKTSWISALVPDPVLREMCVKLDHHLDAANKDSLITAVSHWLVEIGELDSSFKKDVARLKGFLTADRDKVRRPYGRTDSEYPRRTVFLATVNEQSFLVDPTGNSRWWTIPVIKINFKHDIDMQQFWAQIAVDFEKGEQWWLTRHEEKLLEELNLHHRSVSALRERLLEAINPDVTKDANVPAMTPTEVLRDIGIQNPTNSQCKECASILRELYGESKRINGLNKWRVPLR
jgi:putative DNA primase/helicase